MNDTQAAAQAAESGWSAMALRQATSASTGFLCVNKMLPRLLWATTRPGWSAMALRKAASASPSFRCSYRVLPRLL